MIELDNILGSRASEAQIEAALQQVCSYVPSTFTPSCEAFIQQHGEQIIHFLVMELDPQAVCSSLGLCDAEGPEVNAVCVLCDLIMMEVEKALKDERTQAVIKSVLDSVCTRLPSRLTNECESFVASWEPKIIQLIENELSPGDVCIGIGYCPAQVQNKEPWQPKPQSLLFQSEKVDKS